MAVYCVNDCKTFTDLARQDLCQQKKGPASRNFTTSFFLLTLIFGLLEIVHFALTVAGAECVCVVGVF